MIGWAFRQLFGWLAAGLVIYYITVANRAPTTPAPETAAVAPRPVAVPNSLEFHAEKNGHVVLDVAVNGTPVRMVVDTGATVVTLTKADAASAGVGGGLSYSLTFQTANGRTRAAPVRLREIRIGQLEIDNVQAVVVENLGISLLGQSFLRRLDSYEMRDGVLTMNW
jgi:aspartyl protease family protein